MIQRVLIGAAPLLLAMVVGCGGGKNPTHALASDTAALKSSIKKELAEHFAEASSTESVNTLLSAKAENEALSQKESLKVSSNVRSTARQLLTEAGSSSGISFDPEEQLWLRGTRTDGNYFGEYFLDEAATQAAGWKRVIAVPGKRAVDFQVEFTAGPRAGYHGTYYQEDAPGDVYIDRYDFTYPDGHRVQHDFSDGPDWMHGTYRLDRADGTWFSEEGRMNADFSYDWVTLTSEGRTYNRHFMPDHAGTGTIEGSESVLPATLAWGADWNVTITWADGTVEQVSLYDLQPNN